MLDRRVPYELLRTRVSARSAHPNFQVELVSGRGLLLLQSTADSGLQEALCGEIGLALPATQHVSLRADCALLWLSPSEWLLEHAPAQTDALQTALTERLASSLAVVIDMTDAFAYFEIGGEIAAQALMTGCSLDLRTDAFPTGRVARTALADVPAIIWNPGGADCYRCLVDRSVSAHLWDWLHNILPQ